ncbi:hypothetical protein BvCmsH13A_03618 [Escherichia coli]|nr:hypothetical protein BvCmsH13A_03618 [Escherichia coli]
MRLASRFGYANQIRRDRPLTREELMQVVPSAYSALFDHGLASKFDQRFASIRSTGNLTFSTAF